MKTKPSTAAARLNILDKQRNLKMARSAHAYVRGNTRHFYEWLKVKGGQMAPEGPPVWICGDCHVGNIGPLANIKGQVEMAIRDFDQTVIGNPAHDLIRLGLSLATAARGSDLPGVTTAVVLEEMIAGYVAALSNRSQHYKDFEDIPKPIGKILQQAKKREWRHLAQERIEDVKPRIPLGRRFWALSGSEKRAIETLVKTAEVRQLILSLRERRASDELEVVDSAYWMKGCSSLGRLRYAVLVQIGKGDFRDGGLCLIDIKEATKAAAPRALNSSIPRSNGKRVVQGACRLSPFLGERMRAASFLNREVFLRELLPQDLKLELDRLNRTEATSAARYLAAVVGKAHGRQMDQKTRRNWKAELSRHRSKSLAAPSWLWTSVVDLVASHEAAYLEHCRAYATKRSA